MTSNTPADQAEHTKRTREAYDQLAAVWSPATDEGPGRGRFLVADLAEPLPLEPGSLDGITCSLALHYVEDWSVHSGRSPRPCGLAAALGAFADAGFMVDRIAEPQPSAEALRLFPDDLGTVAGVPSFIVYRLWLQP